MDAQELRNLQEAYLEVAMNELDEEQSPIPRGTPMNKRWPYISNKDPEFQTALDRVNKKKSKKKDVSAESYDLYDIILSHLLDEGYADTEQAAQVIMVNMSEEWRESICEELTGERKKRALQIGTELAKRVALAKEGQPITRKGPPYLGSTKKAPSKRGGSGIKGDIKAVWTGYADDRGSGNKSRRRRGIKVQDTSDEL
jgi:hypothetical protein